jgi:cytoskeletal protein RodZ
MYKDTLRLILTITIGVLIVIAFVWLINTYIISAIFKPRFDTATPTEIQDNSSSDLSTPKPDSSTASNTNNSQPSEATNSPSADSNNSKTVDTSTPAKTQNTTKTPDPVVNSDKGTWSQQKDAYNI